MLELQQHAAAPASFTPPATAKLIMAAKISFFMSITSFCLPYGVLQDQDKE
jgi:hypothetical protein